MYLSIGHCYRVGTCTIRVRSAHKNLDGTALVIGYNKYADRRMWSDTKVLFVI